MTCAEQEQSSRQVFYKNFQSNMFDQRFERPTKLLFFMYATLNVVALDGAGGYFALLAFTKVLNIMKVQITTQ